MQPASDMHPLRPFICLLRTHSVAAVVVLAIIRFGACVQDLQREHLISSSHGRRRGAHHHTTPSSEANQQQQRMTSLVRQAISGQQRED